jgi:SAM-dependent methyltransferase
MIIADFLLLASALVLATNIRGLFTGMMILLLMAEFVLPRDVKLTERNFYGVIKVFDRPQEVEGKHFTIRFMVHGNTVHGMQVRDPAYETMPTSYFWKGGPVGDIFDVYTPKKVAIIGLGVGTMNCYSTPKNEITFFEIDAAVLKVAKNPDNFTYLTKCQGRRPPDYVIGDGRLELAARKDKFDLIIFDAFTSDAIPTHLISLEAIQAYLDHLNPKGLILLHISNRYFDLANILTVNAHAMGLKSRYIKQIPKDLFYAAASKWVVMSRNDVSLGPLEDYGWENLKPDLSVRPWTDDYTNLLSTLSFAGFKGGFE